MHTSYIDTRQEEKRNASTQILLEPFTFLIAPISPFAQLNRPGSTPIEPFAISPVTGSCQHPSLGSTAP